MHRVLAAVSTSLVLVAADPALAQRGADGCMQRPAQGWAIRIAPADQPGERLIVTGAVYAADRRTPLAGVRVYVYNTDARGLYSRDGAREAEPYLCGVLTTGPDGRYRVDTVRPASYPGTRIAPHVHFVVWGEGVPEQSAEVRFGPEPTRVPAARVAREAGAGDRFASVRPLVGARGDTLRAVRDLAVRVTRS